MRMITFLKILFFTILLCMLVVTITASLEKGILEAGKELWPDLWFRATLVDAYFGFITFYLWVAYKERGIFAKMLWFLFIMSFGNIAMAIYVLIKLFKLPPNAAIETLLVSRSQ